MPASKKGSAKKSSAKKSATKPVAKKAAGSGQGAAGKKKAAGAKREPSAAFMREMQPSDELAIIIGSKPLPRTEVTKKIWAYIKLQGLQDAKNKRMINADDKLRLIFGGKNQVSMFELTKLVNQHLK